MKYKCLLKILTIWTIIVPTTLSLTHCVQGKSNKAEIQLSMPQQVNQLIDSLNLWINLFEFTSNNDYNQVIEVTNRIAKVLNLNVKVVLVKEKEGSLKLLEGTKNLIKAKFIYRQKNNFEILFDITLKNVQDSYFTPQIKLENVEKYFETYILTDKKNFKNLREIIDEVQQDLRHVESNVLIKSESDVDLEQLLEEGETILKISFMIKTFKKEFILKVIKEAMKIKILLEPVNEIKEAM